MTTPTVTLADWILERIAEEEVEARAALAHKRPFVPRGPWWEHIARYDPARVLAQCAAFRRIVELHKVTHWGVSSGPFNEPPRNGAGCASCFEWHRYPELGRAWQEPAHVPCPTLRALASIYADRRGWREEWA